MNSHLAKLFIGGTIIISFVASVHADLDQLGFCQTPCTGGPADLCLACASHCVKTCEDPSGGACIPECKENACQCAKGYLRRADGQCVWPNQCPGQPNYPPCSGGVHDHRVECGTRCPLTCENPEPGVCTMDCVLNVCQCDKGYVRASNGLCVLPESCPKQCKA